MSNLSVAEKLGLSFPYPDVAASKTDVSEREVKLLLLAGLSALNTASSAISHPVAAGAGDGYGLDTTTASPTTIPAGLGKLQIILSADFAGTVKIGAGTAFSVAGATDYVIPVEANAGRLLPAVVVTRSAGSFRAFGI